MIVHGGTIIVTEFCRVEGGNIAERRQPRIEVLELTEEAFTKALEELRRQRDAWEELCQAPSE